MTVPAPPIEYNIQLYLAYFCPHFSQPHESLLFSSGKMVMGLNDLASSGVICA
jgi:hypothetical protein